MKKKYKQFKPYQRKGYTDEEYYNAVKHIPGFFKVFWNMERLERIERDLKLQRLRKEKVAERVKERKLTEKKAKRQERAERKEKKQSSRFLKKLLARKPAEVKSLLKRIECRFEERSRQLQREYEIEKEGHHTLTQTRNQKALQDLREKKRRQVQRAIEQERE